MKESEILTLMLNSIKDDNYIMAKQSGMSDEEINEAFSKSENGLSYIVLNLYNKLKEEKIISSTL
jgi:hypothetical protein